MKSTRKESITPASAPPSALGRRSFLKNIGAVAAGLAVAPMIVPSRVFGANERVVLGFIGVGNQGRDLIGAFRQFCDIGAIADVYLPRAREVAEGMNVKNVYQDYRMLLELNDIDAVVVATPLHWHALNCIHAAQAGKDIYCEKPLTHSITEGRRIVQAVHKYKRVFQTGSQQRSGRNEHIGLTFVRNGVLGKLERVLLYNYRSPQETGHPHEAVPEGLDWDMWCGPAEKPPYNFVIWDNRSNPSWSGIRPFSGGDMTDWGSHGLDIAQWGLGMDEGGPLEVWTEGEPFTPMTSTPEHPGGRRGGPRSPKVYMRYPGDIIIEFEGGHQSGARFIGERGSINVTRGGFSSDPSDLTAERRMQHPDVVLHRGLEYTLENNHYQDWVNCIKERRDPVAPAEAGHRTATFCHLANIARWVSELTGETGQRLKWDATEERFTNSMEANRFVNPPYRTGYVLPHEV